MSKVNLKLLFNESQEDGEAIKELIKSGINCNFVGPIEDEKTPKLINGEDIYFGLNRIKTFIQDYKK